MKRTFSRFCGTFQKADRSRAFARQQVWSRIVAVPDFGWKIASNDFSAWVAVQVHYLKVKAASQPIKYLY